MAIDIDHPHHLNPDWSDVELADAAPARPVTDKPVSFTFEAGVSPWPRSRPYLASSVGRDEGSYRRIVFGRNKDDALDELRPEFPNARKAR